MNVTSDWFLFIVSHVSIKASSCHVIVRISKSIRTRNAYFIYHFTKLLLKWIESRFTEGLMKLGDGLLYRREESEHGRVEDMSRYKQ